jgi:preprotein translocase subunit YajC
MSDTLTLIILALPLIGIWLLVIRPAQRRQREAAALNSELAVGQDVMTTSGLFGTITALDDESAHLEVAPGVVLRFTRRAVAAVAKPPQPPTGPAGE